MPYPIKISGAGNWPVVRALGANVALNLHGRANLLLDLLYRQGCLPLTLAYGDKESDCVVIEGVSLGNNDMSVQFGIWRMAENYRTQGYLFDEDFKDAMQAAMELASLDLVVA